MIGSTHIIKNKAVKQIACVVGLLLLSPLTHAKFVCWTNSDGYKECGNSVPPEYSQKRTETFDSQGVVTEVKKKAKSRAQYEFEQEEAAKLKAENEEIARLAKLQDEKDRVLLSTFSRVEDIALFKKRNLDQLDLQIKIANIQITQLEKSLKGYNKEAATYERRRKPIPEALQANLDSVNGQISNKQKYIGTKQAEMNELSNKYDADMERFRILKSRQ